MFASVSQLFVGWIFRASFSINPCGFVASSRLLPVFLSYFCWLTLVLRELHPSYLLANFPYASFNRRTSKLVLGRRFPSLACASCVAICLPTDDTQHFGSPFFYLSFSVKLLILDSPGLSTCLAALCSFTRVLGVLLAYL